MQQLTLFPPLKPRAKNGRFSPIYRERFLRMTRQLKREVRQMYAAKGMVIVHRHVRRIERDANPS